MLNIFNQQRFDMTSVAHHGDPIPHLLYFGDSVRDVDNAYPFRFKCRDQIEQHSSLALSQGRSRLI